MPLAVSPAQRVGGVRLQLWRAAAAYRVATLIVVLYLIARWHDLYRSAAVADAAGAGMVIVTVAVCLLATSGRAHRVPVVIADAGVTALLTVATIWAQTAAQRHGTMPTLTTFWAAGPALEAGILAGWAGGVLAGLGQLAAAMVVRGGYDGRTLGSAVLLVVAGGVTGFVSTLAVRTEAELAAATAAQAAAHERERLARTVHDGVLQVLGLIHREEHQATGRWAELARAAGEQEARLRGLITSEPQLQAGEAEDLAAALRGLATPRVNVSAPAHPVAVSPHVSTEVTAAVTAALDNTSQHGGDDVHAWVLLEQLPDSVRVTVRDDGVGFAPGRLEQAQRTGRLGVPASIRGRITDLGGHVSIDSTPGAGTVVELTVPVAAR